MAEQTDPLADRGGRRSGEQADSFSAILDSQQESQVQIGEEGEALLLGHPALDDEQEETEETEGAEDESAEQTTTQEVVEQETETTPTSTFETKEEAERAHAEATRRMHEESQERAELQRRLSQIEDELRLVRQQQIPTQEVAETPAVPEVQVPEFDVKEHWKTVHRRVDALDPDADDFEEQRLEIISEGHRVEAETQQTILEARSRQTSQAEALRVVEERAQQSNNDRLRAKLLEKAAAAGLDAELPSPNNPLGGAHLQDLQAAVALGLYPLDASEDAAIESVIDVVAKRHGLTDQRSQTSDTPTSNGQQTQQTPVTTPAAQNDIQRVQAQNTPMERVGTGPAAQAPREDETRPLSMDEILNASMEHRTIRR